MKLFKIPFLARSIYLSYARQFSSPPVSLYSNGVDKKIVLGVCDDLEILKF